MDTNALLQRRQAVVDFHKLHESVPESPLSPSHPTMRNQDGSLKQLHSERIVGMQDDSSVYVAGPCIDKLLHLLSAWLARPKHAAKAGEDAIKTFARKLALKLVPISGANLDYIELSTQQWNGCMYILHDENETAVLTQAVVNSKG